MVCVRAKLGLGEISLKHAVDNYLLRYIETKVWVCNQLDYQTNPGYIDLFHLLLFRIPKRRLSLDFADGRKAFFLHG